MQEKTYSQPQVQKVLDKFLYLNVDVDHHPQKDILLQQYNIKGVPTAIILNGDGQEIDRIIGFLPPEKFVPRIKSRLRGSAKDNTI
jgi:thiol:disulfide interchange protein